MNDPDYPPKISRPAEQALIAAGLTNWNKLCARSAKEIIALHGFGPKGLRILRAALKDKGLTLRADPPQREP